MARGQSSTELANLTARFYFFATCTGGVIASVLAAAGLW
jgi:hypothetical protein